MMKYYLYAQDPCALAVLTQSLSRKKLIQDWSKKVNPMGVYSHLASGDGVVVEIQDVLQYSAYRNTIERLFQIRPILKVIFHVNARKTLVDGNLPGILAMVQMMSTFLETSKGDAILLTKDQEVLLWRREGSVLLNAEKGFWTPDRAALINVPCEMGNIPTPLSE